MAVFGDQLSLKISNGTSQRLAIERALAFSRGAEESSDPLFGLSFRRFVKKNWNECQWWKMKPAKLASRVDTNLEGDDIQKYYELCGEEEFDLPQIRLAFKSWRESHPEKQWWLMESKSLLEELRPISQRIVDRKAEEQRLALERQRAEIARQRAQEQRRLQMLCSRCKRQNKAKACQFSACGSCCPGCPRHRRNMR